MPISQSYRLREGDTIRVRAPVHCDHDLGELAILITGAEGRSVEVNRDDAELLTTVIRVGDEVREVGPPPNAPLRAWPFGIVVAINGAQGWIRWPRSDAVENLGRLQRTRTAEQVAADEARPDEHRTVESSDVVAG